MEAMWTVELDGKSAVVSHSEYVRLNSVSGYENQVSVIGDGDQQLRIDTASWPRLRFTKTVLPVD